VVYLGAKTGAWPQKQAELFAEPLDVDQAANRLLPEVYVVTGVSRRETAWHYKEH